MHDCPRGCAQHGGRVTRACPRLKRKQTTSPVDGDVTRRRSWQGGAPQRVVACPGTCQLPLRPHLSELRRGAGNRSSRRWTPRTTSRRLHRTLKLEPEASLQPAAKSLSRTAVVRRSVVPQAPQPVCCGIFRPRHGPTALGQRTHLFAGAGQRHQIAERQVVEDRINSQQFRNSVHS